MRLRVLFGLALTFGLIPVFANCRDATQMVVEVTTDVPCAQSPKTNIAVGTLGALAGKTTTATDICTANGTIGTLVIVPSGEDNEEVAFEVTVAIGVDPSTCTNSSSKSCIVARRDLHFLPHETVRINVPMKQVCAGVSCDPHTTCYAGGCVSATIDQSLCGDGVCGEDALGPAPVLGSDGGGRDANVPETNASDRNAPDVNISDTSSPDGSAVDAGPGFTALIADMAFGEDSSCLLTQAGDVYCWGMNGDGQLGIGGSEGQGDGDFVRPVQANAGAAKFQALAAGNTVMAALDGTGALYQWGYNGSGAILLAGEKFFKPTKISDVRVPSSFEKVCTSEGFTCALAAGKLHCWGRLFDANYMDPTAFDVGADVAAVACGDDNVIVRKNDGSFLSMGQSSEALGRGFDGGADAGRAFGPVPGLGDYTTSGTGHQDTFALLSDGGAPIGWGTNRGGVVTNGGAITARDTPSLVPASAMYAGLTHITIGFLHACGLRDKKAFCWGANSLGTTGEADIPSSFPPHQVDVGGDVRDVWAGGNQACAQRMDNRVFCWGANDHGQLGIGTITVTPGEPDYRNGRHPDAALLLAP